MNRRDFMKATTGILGLSITGSECEKNAKGDKNTNDQRWRGFNLLEKFTHEHNAPYRESDFEGIAELGFNFVRLPMSYWCWSDVNDWTIFDEKILREIDQAVEFGKQYHIHVNLNFHRAPGYCVNPPEEPVSLWSDEKAQQAGASHWAYFAERYKGIPNDELSFDLLNEPAQIPEDDYVKVMRLWVSAIREKDPQRLIFADGLRWGREPVHGLIDLNIAQSTRGYDPMRISHHKAHWINGFDKWEKPQWPLKINEKDVWNKKRLRTEIIKPWQELKKKGVLVHVGEWGAYNKTSHQVALAWMRDFLELWKEAGWGWAMWNFRGSFGILDSHRQDVNYESFKGHKLDRKMLELLQTF